MQPKFPFDDLLLFTQHVGAAMKVGVPLHPTIEILAGEMVNRKFRRTLIQVAADLKAGATFHEALSKEPRTFPDYYLRTLKAGEAAGSLPETMEQLVDILQHNFILSQKLKKAFAYPLVILLILGCMGLFYTSLVLPTVESVMEEVRGGEDWLSGEIDEAVVMPAAHAYFPAAIVSIVLIIGILFFLARRFVRAGWCGLTFDRIDLNLPFLGVFTRYAIASRLTRSLASILRCGIPLPEALGLCADMFENRIARSSLLKTRETVEKGETLGTAMLSESLFPPTLVWMLSAAEIRGDFLKALDQMSEFYQAKVETTSAWMVEILEPLMIVLVGVLFVVLAASIFSPILTVLNLGNVFAGF
ncbi:MAG: type II secretion system F family protein [Candidatus Omnitrophica bacterium]|nr:type II secretion system F family protein [Candidatus Omnitrophota bacterium]